MKRSVLVLSVVGMLMLVASMASAAMPDDIVLFMMFDDGSGTDVEDASNYGNDGVATDANWTEGKHGGGYEFDGSAITVEPSATLTALKAPMSIGCWINIISFPGQWQAVAEMESTIADRSNGWKAGLNNASPVFTTYGVKDHTCPGELPVGEWAHLAVTYDGPMVTFYINGEVAGEIAGAGDIDVTQSPRLNIGAEKGTPGNYGINAVLDELWISNVVKTQEEIQELMDPAAIISVEPRHKTTTTWGVLKL